MRSIMAAPVEAMLAMVLLFWARLAVMRARKERNNRFLSESDFTALQRHRQSKTAQWTLECEFRFCKHIRCPTNHAENLTETGLKVLLYVLAS